MRLLGMMAAPGTEPGNVKGFTGVNQDDAVVCKLLADGTKGNVLVTLISQIAVDLVRDYQYVVLQAQLTDPLQLFKGEAAHSGVVGVGHKEQLGAGILQLLLQIVKINLIFAVFVLHKAVLQQLAAVVAYDSGEGRVNRGLNDHLVAGIRIGSDGVHQERKNTGWRT